MTDVVRIKYGAQSNLSRWFKDYWTERDRRAAPWLFVSILVLFLVAGPRLLLQLVAMMPLDQLGNSGASLQAHQTLVFIATVLAAAACAIVAWLLARANLLELNDAGIRPVWSHGFITLKGAILPWPQIASIQVTRPPGKTTVQSYQLSLMTGDAKSKIKLGLGELEGDEVRGALKDALITRAVKAVIDPDVFDALTPRRELSFTEIWLDALSAPPHRERLLPLNDGTLLDGRYRILKKLGAGGQGTVYLAQDSADDSEIVLKETILPVYADLISRRRALEEFHKEAFALESVKHPSIVRFIGSFVADHRAYLILAYVKGRTLSETIESNGILSPNKAIAYGMQMCEILSVLHNLTPPLVHRDFTPDNLMVDGDDKLMLLDFAVAVAGDGEDAAVAGKSSYMAPEQFKGKATPQSDLYSLGCALYYCLTGEHPEPLGECHPILANSDVPKQLSDVVAGATKYDTAQRFADVGALIAALDGLKRDSA